MKIAIDIDDVLGEFFNSLKQFCKTNFEYTLNEKTFSDDAFRANPDRLEIIDWIKQFLHSPELLSVKTVPGAQAAVEKLAKDHELYIVTGRPLSAMDDTNEWLKNNFKPVFKEVFSTDYHIVNGGNRTKGTICQKIKADLLIDDFYKYTEECARYGINSILFTKGWNIDKPENEYIKRADNWQEVLKIID